MKRFVTLFLVSSALVFASCSEPTLKEKMEQAAEEAADAAEEAGEEIEEAAEEGEKETQKGFGALKDKFK